MWVKCKAVKEEGGEVLVECSYFRFPWEPSEVPYLGEPLGCKVVNGKIKVGIKGKVFLKGEEGERGRFGPKEFFFQVPDVGALGIKNGVAVVYVLGKGEYKGTIYGARVEGYSKGDEVFGVPPVRGNWAHLEVGGIWIDKELPPPSSLPEADLDLPYKVLRAGRRLEVLLEDEFYVIAGKEFKAKGRVELPYGSVIVYKGIPERPSRVETEKVTEFWVGRVTKAFKVPGGLVVHTSNNTFVLKNGKFESLDMLTSCYFDEELYAIGKKVYFKGKTFELPFEPFSCARMKDVAVLSIPSKPVFLTIRLFSPTVAVSVPPSEVPWRVPWSSLRDAHLVVIKGSEMYKVTLLPGAYGLHYSNGKLLAYNLFGELRVYDEGLRLIWRREANGVRDVSYGKYLSIWTFKPPRIRVYKRPGEQIFKTVTKGAQVGLCEAKGLIYATDGNALRIFLPWAEFYELRGRIEEGLACQAFGESIAVVGKEKVSVWRVKAEIGFKV